MVGPFVQERSLLTLKMLHPWAKIGNVIVFDLILLAELETDYQFLLWVYQVKPDGTECLDLMVTDKNAKLGDRGLQ